MILDVKGTRDGGSAEIPAEKYVLKSDPAGSRTPFIFGIALAAVSLYLRSMLAGDDPANAAGPDQAVRPARPPDAPTDEQVAATLRHHPAVPAESATDASAAEDPAAATGAPGNIPGMFLGLGGAGSSMRGVAFVHAPILPRPANANHAPRPDLLVGGSSPSGGSSGPSGGGGGGSDDVPITGPDVPAPPDGGGPGSRPGDDNASGGNTTPDGSPSPDGGTAPGPGIPPHGITDEGEEDDDRVNRAPRVSGPVQLMDITACGLLMIGLDDLLANASDPDGDTLTVRNLSVSGGFLETDGSGWHFRAAGMGLGPVTISYQISDGSLAVDQIATFSVVRPARIVGSDGDDLLIGSLCADEIDGRAGDDNIDARSGDDVIFGGDGDDHIVAGDGNDVVWGGDGQDIVFGGAGNDHIFGGAGDDRLFGGDGDDVIQGGDGDDFVSGGTGNDILTGDEGKDELHDGAGRDVVSAGKDDDRVIVAADRQTDVFNGGDGYDIVDFTAAVGALYVDLAVGVATGAETGTDTLRNFEAVIGGAGNDTLKGSNLAEVLAGAAGDDRLFGFGGDDTLIGGSGNDLLVGGAGDDRILDGAGADCVNADAGDDTVIAAIDGADDVYEGGDDHDTLDYSAAKQALIVDLAKGTAVGIEIGQDTISGFERLIGGGGDDHFVAGPGSVILSGGTGMNVFDFRGGETGAVIEAIHEILDFKQGDRIRLSKYDLFESAAEDLEDRFEAIYLGSESERAWIRYRHDDLDDRKSLTRVEADFDRDDTYETTILLTGHHILAFIENA